MSQHLILIPTYNRAPSLKQILDRIQGDYHVVIVNDGSTGHTAVYDEIGNRPNVTMLHQPVNRGRKGFGMTLSLLYETARSHNFRYLVQIPDDAMPCKDFLRRITEAFEQEKREDPTVCAMNILPTVLKNWGTDRFLDNAWIADRRLMNILAWRMPVCKPSNTGSGTGRKMTRIVAHSNCRIAAVCDVSYLKLIDVPSALFPRDPRPSQWWRQNFVDESPGCED